MTKMIFVRHGETEWNQIGKYQGQTDIPLNSIGLMQAEKTAERLANESIQAIYSSDLARALQTAQIIADKHNLSVNPSKGLREFNFGIWEGKTYQEINRENPELLKLWMEEPENLRIPEAETFPELNKRGMLVINELLLKHSEETILVVTHGGLLSTIFCSILGIELNNIRKFKQQNSAISIIDFFEQKSVLTLFNDACHL